MMGLMDPCSLLSSRAILMPSYIPLYLFKMHGSCQHCYVRQLSITILTRCAVLLLHWSEYFLISIDSPEGSIHLLRRSCVTVS